MPQPGKIRHKPISNPGTVALKVDAFSTVPKRWCAWLGGSTVPMLKHRYDLSGGTQGAIPVLATLEADALPLGHQGGMHKKTCIAKHTDIDILYTR